MLCASMATVLRVVAAVAQTAGEVEDGLSYSHALREHGYRSARAWRRTWSSVATGLRKLLQYGRCPLSAGRLAWAVERNFLEN